MPITSDEELHGAAVQGHQESLATLYDRYAEPLYRFIYRQVDHRQEAEDLTSDVMIRMMEQLETFRQTSSFKTWLYAIARHAVADFWRTRYKLQSVTDSELLERMPMAQQEKRLGQTPEDQDRRRTEAAKVMSQLSAQQQHVLQLRFFEQKTLNETAAAMNITVSNVKVLQHRALKKAAEISKGGI